MIPDIDKIAALAMLSLTAEETACLCRDVGEILAITEKMPEGCGEAMPCDAFSLARLREDSTAPAEDGGHVLLSLSKKEKNGYYTVARTVGGTT